MIPWEPDGEKGSRPQGGRSWFSWLTADPVSEAEVRAEIWRLGTRHRGEALEGALAELKAPDIPAREAALLRACVRRLRRS